MRMLKLGVAVIVLAMLLQAPSAQSHAIELLRVDALPGGDQKGIEIEVTADPRTVPRIFIAEHETTPEMFLGAIMATRALRASALLTGRSGRARVSVVPPVHLLSTEALAFAVEELRILNLQRHSDRTPGRMSHPPSRLLGPAYTRE